MQDKITSKKNRDWPSTGQSNYREIGIFVPQISKKLVETERECKEGTVAGRVYIQANLLYICLCDCFCNVKTRKLSYSSVNMGVTCKMICFQTMDLFMWQIC